MTTHTTRVHVTPDGLARTVCSCGVEGPASRAYTDDGLLRRLADRLRPNHLNGETR